MLNFGPEETFNTAIVAMMQFLDFGHTYSSEQGAKKYEFRVQERDLFLGHSK